MLNGDQSNYAKSPYFGGVDIKNTHKDVKQIQPESPTFVIRSNLRNEELLKIRAKARSLL
jgi:hypothetical protein